MLSKTKLGYSRKVLLADIREIKHKPYSKKEAEKHIPKKYRQVTLAPKPVPKTKDVYRVAIIINDIPVHSNASAGRSNYLGFRLLAFHENADYLNSKVPELESLLWQMANEYVHANIRDWYDVTAGKQYAVPIRVILNEGVINRWLFTVEKDGVEKYSRSGFI